MEEAAPELAARVRKLFDAGRHKTIATLRADGSPRISGIEAEFVDGELQFGSMVGARKGADLRRDPRFALHGPTFHPEEGKASDEPGGEGRGRPNDEAEAEPEPARPVRWPGEAKIAGRAVPAGDLTSEEGGEAEGELFVADISEVVVTGLNDDATMLVVESWTPERGLRRIERA